MNNSTAGQWRWLGLLMLAAACGGRVVEEGKEGVAGDDAGEDRDSPSTTGGDLGSTGGQTTGGGTPCAGTKPHPDYSQCYASSYPPCLERSAAGLLERLGVSVRPTLGPWSGTRDDCKMLCCYGYK